MNCHKEIKGPIRIVGIKVALEEEHDKNIEIISAFLRELYSSPILVELTHLSNMKVKGLMAVSVYENPDNISYYIAVSSDVPCPDSMVEYTIPEATWVVYERERRFPDPIMSLYKHLLIDWLPFSGYKYAELPNVEVYPFGNKIENRNYAEVWFAIKLNE